MIICYSGMRDWMYLLKICYCSDMSVMCVWVTSESVCLFAFIVSDLDELVVIVDCVVAGN